MKSFTKLTVLLLTLALLVTSVFAITAFAGNDEVAPVSQISLESVIDDYYVFDGSQSFSTTRIDAFGAESPSYYKTYEVVTEEGGRGSYLRFTSNTTENPETNATSSSYVQFGFAGALKFDNFDYIVWSAKMGTDNEYLRAEDHEADAIITFNVDARDSTTVASVSFCIRPDEEGNFWLCTSSSWEDFEKSKLAQVDNEFEFLTFIDTATWQRHVYVDGNYVGTQDVTNNWATTSSFIRVQLYNYDSEDANLASKEQSFWIDDMNVDLVANSSENSPADLAYLVRNKDETTILQSTSDQAYVDWQKTLYSVYDANGDYVGSYDSVVGVTDGGANVANNADAFRAAMTSNATATVSLKRDVTYRNYNAAATTQNNLFAMPAGTYTKSIYLNGKSLAFIPTDKAGTTAGYGQMFYISGSGERMLNFIGGYDALGTKSSLLRSAAAQCMFRGPSSTANFTADSGVTLNFESLLINPGVVDNAVTNSGKGYFTDGMLGGATWNFTDSELICSAQVEFLNVGTGSTNKVAHENSTLNFTNSKLNITKYRPGVKNCNVNFIGSEVYIELTGTASNQTYGILTTTDGTSVYAKDTNFKAKTMQWALTAGGNGYHIIPSSTGKVVLDEDCRASNSNTLRSGKNTYAPGVVCYRDPSNTSNTYTRKIDLFANLTLASDIKYNLYIPTWVHSTSAQSFTVDGTAVNYEGLETITMKDGSEYFVYSVDFPAHSAFENKTIAFVTQYQTSSKLDLTKTLSITDYIGTVLKNEGDSAEFAKSYGLMADLIDYVNASATYFDETVSDEFAALADLDNYKANVNSNTEIVGADVNYEDVKGYVKGAYLNVDSSDTKFVFIAGTADTVTLSYKSATGEKVEVTYENCNEGQALALEMRAYDLNAVITITVNGGEATGTYDLAAYAASEDAADAADILLEMYNYAVSAKAYKFPEND